MPFSKQQVERVSSHVDIADILKNFIELKRRPNNRTEYIAKCPFHEEKTPSFTVTTTKQFYHCFGCGQHGNVFGFVMEFSNMSYVDAFKKVAELGKVKLQRGGNPRRKKASDRRKRQIKLQHTWRKERRDAWKKTQEAQLTVFRDTSQKDPTLFLDDDIPF